MWRCLKCGEGVEENFEVCWNCGTSRDGVEDPEFRKAEEPGLDHVDPESQGHEGPADCAANPPEEFLMCPRCHVPLEYFGLKTFPVLPGNVGEFFKSWEKLDVYICARCGRLEFFLPGVGEELRPK